MPNLRKPKAREDDFGESECDTHGTLGDSVIDSRTRSSSTNSVKSNRNSSISDCESVASGSSIETLVPEKGRIESGFSPRILAALRSVRRKWSQAE